MTGLPMTERELQTAVLAAARALGWSAYHTFESRRSEPGFPDLVLVRRGRLVFAELKTAKGKITAAQNRWLDLLAATGNEVRVWRPGHWTSGVVERDLRSEIRVRDVA